MENANKYNDRKHEHVVHKHKEQNHSVHTTHDADEDHDHEAVHLGHMAHMGNLKQKFWISLIFTIPIILLSTFMGEKLPFQFSFPGSDWMVIILSTILFFYGGTPFLKGAKMELGERKPAMMTLISMGITVAFIYSLYAFISNNFIHNAPHLMDFFWELATLIVIMLLRHWIEMRSVGNADEKTPIYDITL